MTGVEKIGLRRCQAEGDTKNMQEKFLANEIHNIKSLHFFIHTILPMID